MKTISIINRIVLVISIIFMISCEEVIELDLKNADPQIIIEGVIIDNTGPHSIKISKSAGFYEPSTFDKVSGAQVIISDNTGVTDTLTEVEPGHYITHIIEGTEGMTYNLQVRIEDEYYHAVSTMPSKIELDSISNEHLSTPHGSGEMVFCHFEDQPGIQNYVRIRTYLDDEIASSLITLFDDKLFENGKAKVPVIRGPNNLFEKGDNLRIELLTINYDTYMYYRTLTKEIVGEESAMIQNSFHGKTAPANPVTNISNGALGYFAALCLSSDEAVLK